MDFLTGAAGAVCCCVLPTAALLFYVLNELRRGFRW